MPFDAKTLHADVNAFCEELRPIEELCYAERVFNKDLIPLAKKHNLLGMMVKPEYGGRGADSVSYFQSLIRIGREGTGPRTFFSGHLSIGAYPIQTWGSDTLKKKYLPKAVSGDCILAFGLTEPDAGSNPLEMTTTFRETAEGYILNGVKYLISNGGIAHAVVVFGYPESGEPRRVSAFVVDTNVKGFHTESFAANAKMGMPTSNTAMFEMSDVMVPKENLLGELGDGFRVAMGSLVSGRLSVAAGCQGVIDDCLIESLDYAKMRSQHGKEIARHQLVQDHIAQIEIDRVASESLLIRAAMAKDAWHANPKDKELAKEVDQLAAKSKYFATNAAWRAADRAVQIFGGRGWSTLYRPARHLMDTRVCRIYEGTDEIIKLKVAASLLGKDYEAFK
jgi:alkylation response protein AidB-like acyl-CoA dehydrogenase